MNKICNILKEEGKCKSLNCPCHCKEYDKLRRNLVNDRFIRMKDKGII
jgi:hypothetical protein